MKPSLLALSLGGMLSLTTPGAAVETAPGSAHLKTQVVQAPPFGRLQQETYPYDGVRMQRWRRDRPEVDWLVVWIDLQTPGLGYAVTPVYHSPDPAGAPFQTTRAQTTVDFLRDQNADLAVNTVAYWPFPACDGDPTYLSEPVWQNGDTRRDPAPGSHMLALHSGRATIGEVGAVRAARPICAFGSFLANVKTGAALRQGKIALDSEMLADGDAHGRTAAGVSENGRTLILLVADGYNPSVSIGLTHKDAAEVLRAAGAFDAVFLDGGGSSTLVARGDGGAPVIVNRPAGLQNVPGTLRYVACNLGFTNLRRTAEPLPAIEGAEAPFRVRAWNQTSLFLRVHRWQATVVLVVALGGALVFLRRRQALRLRRLAT